MVKTRVSFWDLNSSYFQPIILLVLDYIAILFAESASTELREFLLEVFDRNPGNFELPDLYFYLWIPAVFIIFLHWGRTYIRLLSIGEMIRRAFFSVSFAIVVSIVVLFLAAKAPVVSRLFITLLGIFVFLFVCIMRLAMRVVFNHFKLFLEPTILVGSDETAKKVLNYTSNNSFSG